MVIWALAKEPSFDTGKVHSLPIFFTDPKLATQSSIVVLENNRYEVFAIKSTHENVLFISFEISQDLSCINTKTEEVHLSSAGFECDQHQIIAVQESLPLAHISCLVIDPNEEYLFISETRSTGPAHIHAFDIKKVSMWRINLTYCY